MNSESLGSTAGTQSGSLEGQDDNAPLWRYVTKLEKLAEVGGNHKFRCNYCRQEFKGSYSRVKSHLLKISGKGIRVCPQVTTHHLSEMQAVVEEAELRVRGLTPRMVPLPSFRSSSQPSLHCSASSGSQSFRMEGFEPRKRKTHGNTAIEKAFNLEMRQQLHKEIARMFYSGGLPFHLARNPYYVSSYSFAANNSITDYLPPGYNMLRITLLQKERENVEKLLEPIRGTWKEKGVSIVSDGWTDSQRRPLINFMGVSETGPMFIKTVNCEGEYKDKFFISNLMKECIEQVGAANVVQIITDNAPVCKAACILVEATYPHIFWTPCVVHTLNLALKNICAAKNIEANEIVYDECHWITIIAGDAFIIRNFIVNHYMRLAIFNEFVNLKMLTIAETRFASVIVMLKRFKAIKRGLQSMVISEKWSCFREDDVQKAQFVKEKILDDLWWDRVDYILAFTEPIYDMLRLADTDKPCLHLVYEMWDTMIEKVKTVIYRHERRRDDETSDFYEVLHGILVDRWNKSNTPLHCLAHSLNPRFYTVEWQEGAIKRESPHKDREISLERNKCLKRIFPDAIERRTVNIEYAKFSTNVDDFAEPDSIIDRVAIDPKLWWVVHGSSTPHLQALAFKLLGQPSSSSCCERNWSTYSFINSMRRNKITPKRAEDLVFVHTNLRLLSRRTQQYTQGESKMWDVGGDAFDSLEGAGILEVADLSLDEPLLVTVLFVDDGNEDSDDPTEIGNE